MQHFTDSNLPARCQGADQLTKDLLSLFSKVPDSFKKQYQAGKSSEKLLWLGEVAGGGFPAILILSDGSDTSRDEKFFSLTLGPYSGEGLSKLSCKGMDQSCQ